MIKILKIGGRIVVFIVDFIVKKKKQEKSGFTWVFLALESG